MRGWTEQYNMLVWFFLGVKANARRRRRRRKCVCVGCLKWVRLVGILHVGLHVPVVLRVESLLLLLVVVIDSLVVVLLLLLLLVLRLVCSAPSRGSLGESALAGSLLA